MHSLLRMATRELMFWRVPQPHSSVRILKAESFQSQISLPLKIRLFRHKINVRKKHYPVQYLCKKWPFRSLDLILKSPVLVPRFETEYLVGLVIDEIQRNYVSEEMNQLKFLELGCGSGAIGLSLHKQLKLEGRMIDIDQKCVELSKINGQVNSCQMRMLDFKQSDIVQQVDKMDNFNIIVSNPPYLSEKQYCRLSKQIKLFQGKQSLVADHDRMKFIRIISRKWRERRRKGILALQFDGRVFEEEDAWLQKFVRLDQYERRRFIIMING